MKRILLLVLLSTLIPSGEARGAVTAEEKRAELNRPLPSWWEGPVRYLLTDEETREFRKLATASRREAFIARFWAARDPDPFAPGNDLEAAFWERVATADELFAATTIAGWRTDRGRVFILLGPPDEIVSYNLPSVSELDPTHHYDGIHRGAPSDLALGQRGAVEWIYRNLAHPAAEPNQLVTFVRDPSGEFVLSGRLAMPLRFEMSPGSGPGIPRITPRRPREGVSNRSSLIRGPSPADSPAAQARQLESRLRATENLLAFGQAAMFEKAVPPQEAKGRVVTAQFFGTIRVRSRLDCFRSTEGTYTLFTLGIPTEDLPKTGEGAGEIQVFGHITRADDPAQAYQFSVSRPAAEQVPLQSAGGEEHRLYQVTGEIPPGEYRINLGARSGEKIGTLNDLVQVPDYSGETLLLAGPMLAESVGRRDEAEGKKAFAVGGLRLVPKLEPVFARGTSFGFYFQAYHARPDPVDGRLHLDIEYHIAVRREGLFRPLGKPVTLSDNDGPAHAYTFPLDGWEAGQYLLTVTVSDRVGGQVRSGTAVFEVE